MNFFLSHLPGTSLFTGFVPEVGEEVHLVTKRVSNVIHPHVPHRDIADAKVGQSNFLQCLGAEAVSQVGQVSISDCWKLQME